MKSLWPVVTSIVLAGGLFASAWVLYSLGSAVGGVLEALLLAIPTFLYNLPNNALAALWWLGGLCWTLITNPLRTFCVVAGMLLVLTYFRGISGSFSESSPTIRGSTVRSAEEIFPDLEDTPDYSDHANQPRSRGSSITNYESLFDNNAEPLWRRTWDRLKVQFTRRFDGDDLL